MFGALLVFLGLAPVSAKSNPCDMPVWTLSESVAFVCDMEDAKRAEKKSLPVAYTGKRSDFDFSAAPVGGLRGKVFIVTNRVVPVEEAPREAMQLGPWGGWVSEDGMVHGANDSWIMPIAGGGSSSKPAGTLVYLVTSLDPAPTPPAKVSSQQKPVRDELTRAE